MNVLMTLLAFAAVMVVFSTIVTVAVEALHKLFRFRRSGMEEMLRTLHDDAIAPRLARLEIGGGPIAVSADPTKVSPEAKRFAREVMDNHAFGGAGRWWWLRNIPGFAWLFQRRFEQLTTLQFAEQIARTDAGQALLRQDKDTQASILSAVAYEFERYGDAQSDYFKRRAKVLCVAVGVVVAASLNLDAVTLFRSLYSDPVRAQSIASQLDAQRLSQFVAAAEQAAARVESNVADPVAAPEAAQALTTSVQQLQGQVNQLNAASTYLSTAGLAFGNGIYPYCGKPNGSQGDPRCAGGEPAGVWTPKTRAALLKRFSNSTGDALIWALSILGTGGLLGLGAPFWFGLFRRLAGVTPAARLAQIARPDAADADAAAQNAVSKQPASLRNKDGCGRDELLRAFTIAAGDDDGPKSATPAEPSFGAAGPGAMLELAAGRGGLSRWLR